MWYITFPPTSWLFPDNVFEDIFGLLKPVELPKNDTEIVGSREEKMFLVEKEKVEIRIFCIYIVKIINEFVNEGVCMRMGVM
ncbi:hypothetical protein POVWA1_038910 [Plasmodium ovale wallikeri]|uniref:Uncharacterized protein n=1 Tax=Plasmodium ovale wallikeri TaxID=864142 RepID=A0A1A8Z4J8_PLAOA|nr:hypothetical protein POVWA1_038910 [Plasmodium ovale wallikeri]